MITVGTVRLHTSWKVAACAAVRATSDGSLPFWYSVCVLYTTSAMYDIVTPAHAHDDRGTTTHRLANVAAVRDEAALHEEGLHDAARYTM